MVIKHNKRYDRYHKVWSFIVTISYDMKKNIKKFL